MRTARVIVVVVCVCVQAYSQTFKRGGDKLGYQGHGEGEGACAEAEIMKSTNPRQKYWNIWIGNTNLHALCIRHL